MQGFVASWESVASAERTWLASLVQGPRWIDLRWRATWVSNPKDDTLEEKLLVYVLNSNILIG